MYVSEAEAKSRKAIVVTSPPGKLQEPSSPSPVVPFNLPDVEVVHSISGRIRLRIPELRFEDGLDQSLFSAISQIPGVQSVRINKWCDSVVIGFDESQLTAERLVQKVRKLNLVIASQRVSAPQFGSRLLCLLRSLLSNLERATPPILQLIIGAGAFSACLFQAPLAVTVGLTSLSVVPIASRALQTLLTEGRIGVDGLDGIAAILMIAQKNITAASFMIALIGLGEYIRELTTQRCKKILDDLLGLAGCSAWLVKGDRRICIPADQVSVGDTVVVYPGELIPVDGLVLGGQASVNQANLTGEALPVEATNGSSVYAGTFLVEGKIYLRCTANSKDSRAGRVMEMVKSAPIYETRTQNYAAQLADKLVLPIIGTALFCGLTSRCLSRVMSIMIFDFSTGIRIAAPTAVLASMQRAGQQGILIKSGGAVERLAQVDAIVWDKTGTLTMGNPKVKNVEALNGFPAEKILAYAAAVEERHHHPAAMAIVRYAQHKQVTIPDRSESKQKAGLGITAKVEGQIIAVGNRRMMESENVDLSLSDKSEDTALANGESLAYVAINGKVAGLISYADQIRPEVPQVIRMLKRRGIKKIFMATGDHQASAKAIASAAGIHDIFSNAYPEQKADLVKSLKEEGYTVAVVGDGINDSPALAHADLGVSLHGATHAAREHADLLLTDNNLRRLPQAIDISRDAMGLVKENLGFVAVPNGIGILLAATGMIGPAVSTLLNNGSAILTALNSLRPLFSNKWSHNEDGQIAE